MSCGFGAMLDDNGTGILWIPVLYCPTQGDRASHVGQVPREKSDKVCPITTYLTIPISIIFLCADRQQVLHYWMVADESDRTMAAPRVQLGDYYERVGRTLRSRSEGNSL